MVFNKKRSRDSEKYTKKNLASVSKFNVGNWVWKSLFVINKYGVVTAKDSSAGKIKIRWAKTTDSSGYEITGSEGMLYGLGNETWEEASTIMLQ